MQKCVDKLIFANYNRCISKKEQEQKLVLLITKKWLTTGAAAIIIRRTVRAKALTKNRLTRVAPSRIIRSIT